MQIKIQLGKMQVAPSLQQIILQQQQTNQLARLSIKLEHRYELGQLPHHHRDPFDRLLMAQAIHETLPILTHDSVFAHYPVTTIW